MEWNKGGKSTKAFKGCRSLAANFKKIFILSLCFASVGIIGQKQDCVKAFLFDVSEKLDPSGNGIIVEYAVAGYRRLTTGYRF